MKRALVVAEGIHELGGALEELIAKLTGVRFEVTCKAMQDQEVRVHIPFGKFPGFGRRFLGWLSYAEEHRFDVLIALIDEDGKSERLTEVADAQSNDVFKAPRAFGVAVQAFDTWMLADEKAISAVFQRRVEKIGSPERLKNPKKRFLTLRDAHGVTESSRELYKQIAIKVDTNTLELACPQGFKPFADRVRALFSSLP